MNVLLCKNYDLKVKREALASTFLSAQAWITSSKISYTIQ